MFKTGPFNSMAQMKSFNKEAGFHFFSRATMKFFDSKIHPTIYGGRFFITSERFHGSRYTESQPRRWTIREMNDSGSVSTTSEGHAYDFQEFASLEAAKFAVRQLVQS